MRRGRGTHEPKTDSAKKSQHVAFNCHVLLLPLNLSDHHSASIPSLTCFLVYHPIRTASAQPATACEVFKRYRAIHQIPPLGS